MNLSPPFLPSFLPSYSTAIVKIHNHQKAHPNQARVKENTKANIANLAPARGKTSTDVFRIEDQCFWKRCAEMVALMQGARGRGKIRQVEELDGMFEFFLTKK